MVKELFIVICDITRRSIKFRGLEGMKEYVALKPIVNGKILHIVS